MPTREEKLAFIQAKLAERGTTVAQNQGPSREEKLAFIQKKLGETKKSNMADRSLARTLVGSIAPGLGPIADHFAQRNPDAVPNAEAAVHGAIQSATGMLSDEIAGGVESAGRAVGVRNLGGSFAEIENDPRGATLDPEELRAAYERGRDRKRELYKAQARGAPVSTMAGQAAGAFVSPLNKVAAGKVALQGLGLGAVNGLGASEAEDAMGLALDTAKGGGAGLALGGLVQYGAPVLASAAEKVSKGSESLAKNFAARAIGGERGTVKRLGREGVDEVGEYALKNNLLSPLASAEDMIVRNDAVIDQAGRARNAAYSTIDDAGASTFNPLKAATKVEDEVIGGLNRTYDDTRELVEALDPHLSNILSRGEGNISMKEAQALVESLGKKAKFDSQRNNTANDVAVDAYHALRKAVNEAAGEGAEVVGVSGLRDVIEGANKTMSSGLKAKGLLDNKFAREQGNKLLGLTDTIATAEAAATAGGPVGAAVLTAKKGIERYGSQNTALGLNKLSKSLASTPKLNAISEKSPETLKATISRIGAELPAEKLQRVASGSETEVAQKPLKGEEKWANDGLRKIEEHTGQKLDTSMMSDKQIKRLLIEASDLKPGSKAMENVIARIQSQGGER